MVISSGNEFETRDWRYFNNVVGIERSFNVSEDSPRRL